MHVHPRFYIAIVDMRMIWWMSFPTWEDQRKADAAVYTLGDFFTKTINLVISRHISSATKIIIASGPYKLLPSIKHDKNVGQNKVIRQFQECSWNWVIKFLPFQNLIHFFVVMRTKRDFRISSIISCFMLQALFQKSWYIHEGNLCRLCLKTRKY